MYMCMKCVQHHILLIYASAAGRNFILVVDGVAYCMCVKLHVYVYMYDCLGVNVAACAIAKSQI